MRYLESVDCYIDNNNRVYETDVYGVPNLNESKSLKDMPDEWWDRMSPLDLARIDVNGGLY